MKKILLLLIAFVSLMMFAFPVSAALTDGLVVLMNMNENSGSTAADAVGGNNPGTLSGAGWTTGKYGSGTTFNGNDKITFPNTGFPSGGAARTMAIWVKTSQSASYVHVAGYGTSSSNSMYQIGIHSGQFFFSQYGGAVWSGTSVSNNQWHQLVVSSNGNAVRVFVDGVFKGSGSVGVNTALANGHIGERWEGTNDYSGAIDSFMLWNRQLSDQEVSDLYSAGELSLADPCTDVDGDNYGAEGTDLTLCSGSTTLEDCNDNDEDIHPGAVEIHSNGIDEDCSGSDDTTRSLDCNVDDCTGLVGHWNFDDVQGDDDFTGTSLDTTKWTVDLGTVTQDGNLDVAGSGGYTYVNSYNKWAISGDFDIQVDWSTADALSSADKNAGIRAQLDPSSSSTNSVKVMRYRSAGGTNGYYLDGYIDSVYFSYFASSTQTSGKLRLVRSGSSLTGYYYNNGWVEIGTKTGVFTGDVYGWLWANGFDMSYDNYAVVNGEVLADSTANNNDGNIDGPTWATGKFDNALSFDGVNDYIDVGSNSEIVFSSDFTANLWVKTSDSSIQFFISNDDVSRGWYFAGVTHDGQLFPRLFISPDESEYTYRNASVAIDDGSWHMITSVFEAGSRMDIYIDGVKSNAQLVDNYALGIPNSISSTGKPVYIGDRAKLQTAVMNGLIDDVSLWSKALSDSEVATLYGLEVGCTDADGDGFGESGSDLSECNYTVDYDCDDTDSAINPLAIDIPNNAVDEDCSGADATANYDASVTFTYDYNVDGFWGYHIGDDIGYDVTFEKDSSAHEDDVTGVVVNLTDVEGNVLLSHDLLDMSDTGTGTWSGVFDTTALTTLQDDKINMRVYVYGASGLLDWAPHQDQVWITGTPGIDSFNVGGFTVVTNAPSNVTVRDLAVSLSSFGKINFSRGLGEGLDFSSRVIDCNDAFVMGDQFMTVVSEDYPELNTSAVVSLENVACPIERSQLIYYPGFSVTKAGIQAGGLTCPEGICSDISCVGSTLTFTVEHFSGYAYGASSNLTISDSAEGSYVENDTSAVFSAYYINSTDGSAITGATCTVDFDDGSGSQAMSFSTDHYEYTKTAGFTTPATHDWNVSCSKTGYTSLFAEDTISVQAPAGAQAGVPEFSTWTLLIGLMVIIGGFFAVKKQE